MDWIFVMKKSFYNYDGRCLLPGKSHLLILLLKRELQFWPPKCHVLRLKCHSQFVLMQAIHLGKDSTCQISDPMPPSPHSEPSVMSEDALEGLKVKLLRMLIFWISHLPYKRKWVEVYLAADRCENCNCLNFAILH